MNYYEKKYRERIKCANISFKTSIITIWFLINYHVILVMNPTICSILFIVIFNFVSIYYAVKYIKKKLSSS
ncbi:MAG: hypothetical protein US15_C0012G0014 [Candidatus Moranbacteria bacterium GW2011_GWF1_36_4]|nr:MAG: hypothetical protein US15_C0012G0014 [Candidatus Moranbacteria bacterium GW2011_GWF1_36_4]